MTPSNNNERSERLTTDAGGAAPGQTSRETGNSNITARDLFNRGREGGRERQRGTVKKKKKELDKREVKSVQMYTFEKHKLQISDSSDSSVCIAASHQEIYETTKLPMII